MVGNQQIAVIGAGLMGHGIALTFANSGHPVAVMDPVEDSLRSVRQRVSESLRLLGTPDSGIAKTLEKIELFDSVPMAVKDAAFVFEAAPENLDLKRSIFGEIEDHAPERALLASNTSAIPISRITGKLSSRHRALGTHWWNPPHMIPLVEVIKTEWTNADCAQSAFDFLKGAGKTPVMVERDVPGFIGNRLQHALWREAMSLVTNGICTAEAVDNVVKAGFGRRLAVLGPLENADLIGIDLTQDIHRQLLPDLETSGEPSPHLQELLEKGRTGIAAGAGFRDWNDGDLAAVKARIAGHLRKLEAILPN